MFVFIEIFAGMVKRKVLLIDSIKINGWRRTWVAEIAGFEKTSGRRAQPKSLVK